MLRSKFLTDDVDSRQLMEEVVADPLAAVRSFYVFIKFVLRHLFNVSPSVKTLLPDGVAGAEQGGIAGIVSSCAGVVEAQLRRCMPDCDLGIPEYGGCLSTIDQIFRRL